MTLPLEGIRVIEVDNWGFAPSAGCVLGDWGAEVIKVEDAKRGDPLRGIFGSIDFGGVTMANFLHEQWNRNKLSVGLDLGTDEGREVLDELLATADVFLTNYLPAVRDKFRLNPDDISKANPSIVYALATGQGTKGPDAAKPSYDYISGWARAGVGERLTVEGGPLAPLRAGFVDTTAGNFLAGAISAALVRKERSGEGSVVDLSLLAAGAWIIGPDIANYLLNDFELPSPPADGAGAGPMMTWYECADGRRLVFTMMNPDRYWPALCEALGVGEDLGETRFDSAEKRAVEGPALMEKVGELIGAEPRSHWATRFNKADIIWAPVQPPSEYVEDVQVKANGYLLDIDHRELGKKKLVSSPAQFDNEPIEVRHPAPSHGADTDAVLTELGWSSERIAGGRERGLIA